MFKHITLLYILCSAFFYMASGQGLKFESPRLEGFHPLDDEPFASSPLTSENPVILKMEFTGSTFKDTAIVDFEKRQITFRRYDDLGFRLWEYHYNELSDYLLARRNYALLKGWKGSVLASKSGAGKSKSSVMKFQWEMPVHYPSWAQRVIGTDPPRLSINGSLTITMGFDNSTQIESSTDQDHASNTGFDFQVDYQFSIVGSIGRLISINISADNQNEFAISDVFKNFKIHYKESKPGELEDEIIQEVEAGWTAFKMPGTELSGYSESNEGLFGIKVRSQLGPLSLTSVISHERGEAQKKTIPLNGMGDETVTTENEYVQNKYFFLDNRYRRYYNQKYGDGASVNSSAAPEVDTLIIFKSYQSNKDNIKDTIKATLENDNQPQKFVRMHRDRHYFLNEKEGWIRFADTADITNSIVAIYMRTKDSNYDKGKYGVNGGDTAWNLWVLKPKDPIDSAGTDLDTSRFYLMWRNVYDIDSSDWGNFKFRIVQKTDDDAIETEAIGNDKISDILGISIDGAIALDQPHIFDKNNGHLIIPPFNTSFFGNEPFRNPKLKEYQDSLMYKYSSDMLYRKNYNAYYKIYTMKSSEKTSFSLGWDLMEGEIIKADGTQLQRNVDYTLDYSSGELNLVSARARNAESITAEYQQAAMFVPEKKIFFGNRAELKLPFISDNSFAGLSFLYQNVKVNEKIPQLEQEPYSKGLLDFNIRIDLEPEWMTNLVNKIPLVKTSAESKMVLDFEYARSFMDPNPEGEAYVDDFEDSKQYSILPRSAQSWYQASPPFNMIDSLTPDSLHLYPPAWDFYWFSPRDDDNDYRVKTQDIKDITETVATASTNDYEEVLRLHCVPSPGADYNSRYRNSWAGIMTPIFNKDKSEEQYLEFLMSAVGGFRGKGKLLIQLGTIREDISINGGPPNRSEDTEDPTLYDNPDNIDSDLDRGLDTLKNDSLEYYLIPGVNRLWDTLRIGDPLLGPDIADPGRDNFRKYENEDGKVENRRFANRRQGDQKLTSEDINYDGMVYTHKTESFFEYSIDLSNDTAPFIDKNANVKHVNGWRKYRIPLKEVIQGYEGIRDSTGNPDWKNIEMVRLIWTGFDGSDLSKEYELILSDMQFVGSQWLPLYDSVGTKIEAGAINNKDDNFYKSEVTNERLVLVETDKNGDVEQESSLRLNFKNIKPGDTALVSKVYNYHQIDISAYNSLSMAVYGRDPYGGTAKGVQLYDGMVDFVFRFGSDDSTYYEYRSEIYSGWQEVKIDLRKIAELKDNFMTRNSDTIPIEDSTDYGRATLRVVSKSSNRQPNFSRIQWVGIGVLRDSNDKKSMNSSGEIWINEMKVSGIGKLSGRAIRANINTQWADFVNLSGNLMFTDGDFRKMTENSIKRQNSVLTTSMSSSMRLDKFMPQDWGISLPVGVNYNHSTTRPQSKSNSDVTLTDENGQSDGILELITDKASPSRHYQQKSASISTYVNFDKTENSDNPLVNLTADRISGNFKYNTSNSQNRQGPSNFRGIDYEITNDSKVYTGNLKYDLSPTNAPNWTSWRPFGSLKGSTKLSEYELTLLPENFTFDLIDMSQGTYNSKDTKRKTNDTKRTFDVRHGMDFQYIPISPLLELNYSLDISRDLQKYADGSGSEMFDKVFSLYKGNSTFARQYYILEGEKSRSQSAKVSVDPKFFDWLSTTADYSSDYRGDIVRYRKDSTDYISARVNNTFSFDAVFNFDQALQNLASATSKSNMAAFFSSVDSFFNAVKFSSVSFSYTAAQGLVNNYMNKDIIGSGFEFLKYQLGVKGKDIESFFRGDMDDDFLGGMKYRSLKNDNRDFYNEDRRSSEQRYTLSSGLSLSVPFQLTISPISLSWNKQYELHPDTSYFDTTITFPDFSLGLRSSALMKVTLISSVLQSFEINSNLNFKRQYRNKNSSGTDTTEDFSMSPLVGIQGTIKKWPINFSYRSKISRSKTFDKVVNKKVSTGGHELDISYRIERNSRLSEINLLRWKIPVRGKTTMGLTGSRELNKEVNEIGITTRDDISYSIKPYLTYIFTDNITGSFEYTHGKVKKKEREDITRKLALIANIQFN